MYTYMCVCVFVPVYVCMCVQIKQRMDEEEYSAFLLHLFVCTRVCMFKTVVFIPVGVHIHTYLPVYACLHAHSKKNTYTAKPQLETLRTNPDWLVTPPRYHPSLIPHV